MILDDDWEVNRTEVSTLYIHNTAQTDDELGNPMQILPASSLQLPAYRTKNATKDLVDRDTNPSGSNSWGVRPGKKMPASTDKYYHMSY